MTIPPETIERIKTAADIVEVIGRDVVLKKNGMDYFGLCPFHSEKTSSFSVAPDKQIFYCFGCGACGDVFEFLVKKDGISFPEAVCRVAEQYGIEIGQAEGCRLKAEVKTRNQKPETRNPEYVPDKAVQPADVWREKAGKLVVWAHESLLKNDKRLAWLADRGIGLDLVKEFCLGWNPGENGKGIYRPRESWGCETAYKEDGKTRKKLWIPVGYVIPLVNKAEGYRLKAEGKPETRDQEPETIRVERIRIRTEREQPKYYVLPGSGMRCLVSPGAVRAYVVIESELDAIMVWGKIRANKIGVVATGSAQRHPDLETYELLKKAPVILNALDYDQAGEKAIEWWEDRLPETNRRWPVPGGKDPGDAFKAGCDIAGWVRAGLPEAWAWEIKGSSEKTETRNYKPETGLTETFGRSDLLNENKKGGGQEEVTPLEEFAELLKKSPVTIRVSPERLKFEAPDSWSRSFPERSQRISTLVFLNKEVRSFLMGLGCAEVNARNIESRILDIEHLMSNVEKKQAAEIGEPGELG